MTFFEKRGGDILKERNKYIKRERKKEHLGFDVTVVCVEVKGPMARLIEDGLDSLKDTGYRVGEPSYLSGIATT